MHSRTVSPQWHSAMRRFLPDGRAADESGNSFRELAPLGSAQPASARLGSAQPALARLGSAPLPIGRSLPGLNLPPLPPRPTRSECNPSFALRLAGSAGSAGPACAERVLHSAMIMCPGICSAAYRIDNAMKLCWRTTIPRPASRPARPPARPPAPLTTQKVSLVPTPRRPRGGPAVASTPPTEPRSGQCRPKPGPSHTRPGCGDRGGLGWAASTGATRVGMRTIRRRGPGVHLAAPSSA